MGRKLTLAEYVVLKEASEVPEFHVDLLEEPGLKSELNHIVEVANRLADEGYLKNLGGISQEEYSYKITKSGRKCLEENERERAKG